MTHPERASATLASVDPATAAGPVSGHALSASLLQLRARRLLWLPLLPLLALVVLLAAWQAYVEWQRVLQTAAAEARVQARAFEVVARDASNHVVDLMFWMRRAFMEPGPDLAPAVADALKPRKSVDDRLDGFSLDALSPLLQASTAQLLWPEGDGTPPPTAVLKNLQTISAVIEVAHRRNPDAVWSYFFGLPEKHLIIFPWVPSRVLAEEQGAPDQSQAVVAWYDYEVVAAGLGQKNPLRQAYWTAPYMDGGGKGLLVSHASPLVIGDELRGIVATDISLHALERLLDTLPGAPWLAWVVDDRGYILADRQSPLSASGPAPAPASAPEVAAAPPAALQIADRLPAGIDLAALAQAAATPARVASTHGHRVVALRIGGSPWTLVLAAPDRALLATLSPQVLAYTLIAVGLLAVWMIGQSLLRRRVLAPALEVLGYLQRLSARADEPEPALGPLWQPWARVVTQTFASMRQAFRRQAQAETLKSAIVDHAQSAVVVADEQGRIVEFNPAAEAMLRCPREQAVGRTVRDLISPEHLRPSFEATLDAMRAGDPNGLMGQRLQRVAMRADGTELPVELVLWMTQVDGTAYFTVSMTDLTDAKAAADVIDRQREALRQSEKLTAMGSLLAGVAHELNNPLAIVMGRASLLEEKTEGTPLQGDAVRIREAAERCGRIVRTFLNMARSRPAQRGPVRLNDLARAAADMLGYTLRSHAIELELMLADGLPEVQADADQIGQVVLNLIVNAQQALAAQAVFRRIELRTGVDEAAGGLASVWLRIRDNGAGIDPALRERVFEPFFTTKAEGMGTGLGLSVSRGIVREHGGDLVLDADVSPGGGASFRLSLPLVAASAAEHAAPRASAQAAASSARVLVVDDEPEIAEFVRSMLEGAGYEVAIAESGAVALALLDNARFDAIVSDLRMPDMDGAALWRAVRDRDTGLARRIVFVTGDTLSPGARQFLEEADCPRLDKPFIRADLLAALSTVLRPAPSHG